MSEAGSKNPKEAERADAKAAKGAKKSGGKREINAGTKVEVGERARDANYVPRFKKRYNDEIKKSLIEKFGYSNIMQVSKVNKIVLNIVATSPSGGRVGGRGSGRRWSRWGRPGPRPTSATRSRGCARTTPG